MKSDAQIIRGRLRAALLCWRLGMTGKGAAMALALAVIPLCAGVVFGAGGVARILALVAAAAGACVVLCARVFCPLARPLNALDAAFLAERKTGAFGGRVAAAADILGASSKGAGADEEMLAALAADAAEKIRGMNVAAVAGVYEAAKIAAIWLAAAGLAALALHSRGFGPGDVTRFATPPYMPQKDTFELVWMTGDTTVPVGGRAEIFVVAKTTYRAAPLLDLEREGLEPYHIEMKAAEDAPRDILKRAASGDKIFEAVLESVAGDMKFRARQDDYRSDWRRIFTAQPPQVKNISIRLEYPPHTGLLPDEREGGGDARAPYGSKIKIKIESSSKLSSATLDMDKGKDLRLKISGTKASGEFVARINDKYKVGLKDLRGFENARPPEYMIESVPDGAPEVKIISPAGDLTMPRVAGVAIKGGARDDYGVAAVRLNFRISGGKWIAEKLPIRNGRDLLFEYVWDISKVDAYEGDTLEYYLSATDNDALTGPKTARSESRKIRLLSRLEDFQKTRAEQKNMMESMENMMREGGNISEKFRDLAMSMDSSKKGDRKWRADAERTMERQKALESELSELSKSMKDSIERMKNNDLVNMDTISKMREVNQMMDKIMTDEIRELMEKVRRNISQVDLNNIDKKLLENMADQEKILKALDQTLERLKKIRAEQQMGAMKKQLENLLKRQERLMEKGKELDRKGKQKAGEGAKQAKEQEKIKDETAETLSQMDELTNEMEELNAESARRMSGVKEMAKKGRLEKRMEDASEKLRSGQTGDALKDEQSAKDTLEKMSAAMNAASEKYESEMSEKMKKLARELLSRTLDISQAHEKVSDMTEKTLARQHSRLSADERDKLLREERISAETLGRLKSDLDQLIVMTMSLPPNAAWRAADAKSGIEESMRLLSEDNLSAALGAQKNASRNLNQLAIALLDAGKKMSMPSEQSALDELMSQLRNLAGSQEDLNSQTQKMGNSGMPMPGMGDALSSLALQQQLINEGLGKLSEEMQRLGQSGERLGQIQEEMEKIQKALAGGDAGGDVQRRQADVLRRLKDATLSLKKESLEEKRVAEKARKYELDKPKVKDLMLEALPESVRLELEKFRKDPRPGGYERLIERYYNELMRSGQ